MQKLKQDGLLCHKDKLVPDKSIFWQFHYFRQGQRLTIQKTFQLPIGLACLLNELQNIRNHKKFPFAPSFWQFLNFGGACIKVFQVLKSSLSTFFLIHKLGHLPPNCTKETQSLAIILNKLKFCQAGENFGLTMAMMTQLKLEMRKKK